MKEWHIASVNNRKAMEHLDDPQWYQHFSAIPGAWLTIPDGFLFPEDYSKVAKELQAFEARKDDIFVATFPKAGTTWIQEIVYLIMSNIDLQGAKQSNEERFPYLETGMWEASYLSNTMELLRQKSSPRLIKTHLAFQLLPPSILEKEAKIIFLARNPKDTLVSYYHFSKMVADMAFKGSLQTYFDYFLEGKVPYGHFWKLVLSYWEKRHLPNIHFLMYEDLKKDPLPLIMNLAEFLNKPLSKEDAVRIAQYCTFENMEKNPAVNREYWRQKGLILSDVGGKFMRKGQVGDWKNHFTPEMDHKINKWIQDNSLNSDLVFNYDL